jgi:hypothetical protein
VKEGGVRLTIRFERGKERVGVRHERFVRTPDVLLWIPEVCVDLEAIEELEHRGSAVTGLGDSARSSIGNVQRSVGGVLHSSLDRHI